MNIKITSSFDVQKILNQRGMGKDNRLRKYLAARVRLRADPYVPFRSGTKKVLSIKDTGAIATIKLRSSGIGGTLKNTAKISKDGAELVYNQPYAHYQYHGMVMGPNVLTKKGWRSMAKKGEKYYTGRAIEYNGAPMRGKKWIARMMAEHREDVEKDVAAYLSRKGKNG